MRFIDSRPFANPEATAQELMEIANSVEPVQDGRIYIELINGHFYTITRQPGGIWRRPQGRDRSRLELEMVIEPFVRSIHQNPAWRDRGHPAPGTPRRDAHTVAQGFDPCIGASSMAREHPATARSSDTLRRNCNSSRRPLSATRRGSDRVLVVARQKDDPVAALDDRIGSQGGRNQVIETFHELGAGERLRDEGGGREPSSSSRRTPK